MTEHQRHDDLDGALDALISEGKLTPMGDAELDALLRLASNLRGLPDPDFKARLRAQLFPEAGQRSWQAFIRRSITMTRIQRAVRRPAVVASLALAVFALVAAAGAVIGLVVIPGGGEEKPPLEPGELQLAMTATEADAIGIEPDTAFVLTSQAEIDAEFVRSRLQVEPAVELNVEQEEDRRFRITATAPLDEGRVYRFSLVETASAPRVLASWAFQTKSPIGVVQTLPRHQATEVPVNTGIELTFSHDGVQDVAGHFQIDPPAEGRFEVHKRVVVFVPKELAAGTLYTVTLRAGLGVAGTSDVMAEDFVFQFETGDTTRTGDVPQRPVLNFLRRVGEASTLEAPALEMYTSQAGALTLPVEVYRYADVTPFLAALQEFHDLPTWAGITRESFAAATDGLELVATFDANAERLDEYGQIFVRFPQPLPAGFYLVQSRFQERPIQSWLQVTNIASYVAVSSGKTLVWVNDLEAKGPLAGARLQILGTGVEGETDAQGAALLDTPNTLVSDDEPTDYGYIARTETSGNLLVTAPDGRSAIVPLSSALASSSSGGYSGGYYGYTSAGDQYWHYISTDRPLYLPSDTVRFWGVARRREDPQSSEELTVELGSGYFDYYYRPVRIAETQVSTSSLGTFSGELSFKGLSPGYYVLTVKAGDQVIDSISVPVETYTKPAYKIDVVPSRRAVFAGERVDFAVRASFLEGSPVPQLRLRVGKSTVEGPAELTTDDKGEATVSLTARAGQSDYVDSNYLGLTPVLAEEGEISGEAWVSVHPADLTISDGSARLEQDQGVIEGTVHHVDLSRINDGTSESFDDYLGDPAQGVPVSVQIIEQSWRQREVGDYYDFIAKIVRKRYEYDEIRAPLGTFTATADAEGDFRYAFPVAEEKYYEIVLSVTDDVGRNATQRFYVSGKESLFNARSTLVYLSPPGGSGGFFGGADDYALGDDVVLEMRRAAELLPAGGDNRYLFFQAQNGIREHAVQPDSTLRFTFGETNVPDTTVLGVWFNGRTYLEARYGYELRFDPAERELQIEVTPGRERYEPGDEATLDVLVTDAEGRPQADAEVNLAVVDEAIFLIQGSQSYNLDVLQSLYRSVGSGILFTYASHQYPNEEQPAERGGDGGPRREFADIAFFGQVTTDGEGRASVTFDLPDNLTSWRVTAQGFTDDLKAGTALRQVPVGLPFFVDVTMNNEYLASDRPVIKVRSFGRELTAGQEVTFEVSAPTLGLTEPVRVTAPAFQAARVPLPELREGEHELLIAGSAGGMEDSLVRTIRVVPSRLVAGQARFYEIEDRPDVEGSPDGTTQLVFADHERGRYLAPLQQLSWGYGDRVDQLLARDLAAQLLPEFFEQVETRGEPFDASIYQTPDGGIALFPYADDDLALSARVAALAPDRVGRTGLSTYFLRVTENLNETRERKVIALYGLAALGEPVLVPLQALLGESDLTWRERLYLGLAAQELGDDTTAGTVLRGLISDYGESRAPLYRLRVGTDQDDILEATSLAAILAAGLGDGLAPALFDYTTNNYTTDILVELEQISYLANALPRLSPEPARFAYTLDGRRKEVTLERGETFALRVTPEELKTLELEQIEGRVGVAALFTAPLDPADVARDPDIGVTRQYGGATGDTVVLEEGELVPIYLDVEFGPQALDGCYQLTDLLPSGLKPITRPYAFGLPPSGSYFYRVDGQRVSFCAWNVPPPPGFPEVEPPRRPAYYARVVTPGEYTAEPAVIQSMESAESINLSEPGRVEIR